MSCDEDSGSQNGADAKSVLSPVIPSSPDTPSCFSFSPLVTVVGFHHARGPEVESWFGVDHGVDPAIDFGWSLLPFMALSDGAHASVTYSPSGLPAVTMGAIPLTDPPVPRRTFPTLPS